MDIKANTDIAFKVTLSGQQPRPQEDRQQNQPLQPAASANAPGPDRVSFSREALDLARQPATDPGHTGKPLPSSSPPTRVTPVTTIETTSPSHEQTDKSPRRLDLRI